MKTATGSPGFVDCHVHIRDNAGLDQLARAGIIAAREAGLRENAAQVGSLCPTQAGPVVVIRACWALYKKGGYGSQFGVAVDSLEEIRTEILKLKQAGAGIIKVMASGIVSLRRPGSITPGGFTGDELKYIVQESARAGLGVMAHANGEEAITASVRAGVRSLEHGFFMTARALDVIAKYGTFWTPTVGALARAADKGKVSAEVQAYVGSLIRSHQEMILRAHALGVTLAIGTDYVLPDARYKDAYEAELRYFGQAGLSRDAVLVIACDNGARLLGLK
ncbi:MAG: amidohydrolase family protein [Betaproteobacteria bacterium]